MFDNLSDKLDKAFHILKGHGKITDVNVADTLKEVRRALLDADVNFKIAKDFTTRVKEKAIGETYPALLFSHGELPAEALQSGMRGDLSDEDMFGEFEDDLDDDDEEDI